MFKKGNILNMDKSKFLLQYEDHDLSTLGTMKQEILDDNDEAHTPQSLCNMQKVPSISDLSDQDSSLGKSL